MCILKKLGAGACCGASKASQAWLEKVLSFFMGSINHALQDNIAPSRIDKPMPSRCDLIRGMINMLEGKQGGPWWAGNFKDINIWLKNARRPVGPGPTYQESVAVIMMQGHINYDLSHALKLYGPGTNADFACIGKVVEACAIQTGRFPETAVKLGPLVHGKQTLDPQDLRDKMRQEVIDYLQRRGVSGPYSGVKKAMILEWKNELSRLGC